MTAAETQAIQILSDMVKEIARNNAESHQSLTDLIRDVERRLCAKIEKRDEEVKAIIEHCKARQIEVDATLAKRKLDFDAEVAEARVAAVAEAKAPTILQQASLIIGRRFWRAVVGLALIIGMLSTLLLILERFGVL